jgi:hypothetical protein
VLGFREFTIMPASSACFERKRPRKGLLRGEEGRGTWEYSEVFLWVAALL